MESLLVAGAQTMVGANFAVQFAEQFEVTACFANSPRKFSGCRSVTCNFEDARAIAALIAEVRPQRIVYCGVGACSAWEQAGLPLARDVEQAEHWIQAAKSAGVSLTVISSDAVFTGPWMFHAENSQGLCPSAEATFLRTIEAMAQEALPESLVIRTNAFGWGSPWLEQLLCDLELNRGVQLDCVRHASPILVNDLIEIVAKCWQAGVNGVYHVGGAERANPAAFAQRLAAEFAFKIPKSSSKEMLTDRSSGFGCSEMSLQTRKVRRALGISVPMLSEGLRRLRQLSLNGYRDRLSGSSQTLPPAKVA